LGSEVFNLPIGGVGQPGKDVLQIGVRVDGAAAATFHQGVEDGAALTSLGFSDEEPVFLSQGSGANGVFYAEVSIMPRSGEEEGGSLWEIEHEQPVASRHNQIA
jgi:hypothetical protein